MKKIEAVIRQERLDAVRVALESQSYFGMTVSEVSGRGQQKGLTLQWRVGEYCMNFLPKIKIEVVVLDEDAPKVLDAITNSARTGEVGDGKIFVYAVESVIRVRTGERDEEAL